MQPPASIGYECVPEHEDMIPERRYFHKGAPGAGRYHLHMVETGSEFWERHLLFREYLRACLASVWFVSLLGFPRFPALNFQVLP